VGETFALWWWWWWCCCCCFAFRFVLLLITLDAGSSWDGATNTLTLARGTQANTFTGITGNGTPERVIAVYYSSVWFLFVLLFLALVCFLLL
jgi:hypothetical protein